MALELGYGPGDYLPHLRCSEHGILKRLNRGQAITAGEICCPAAAKLWAALHGSIAIEPGPWGGRICDLSNETIRALLECCQVWQYQSASDLELETITTVA